MLEYVLLGDSIEDGILGWVTVGVNSRRRSSVHNAGYIDGKGGHVVRGAGAGGSGGWLDAAEEE